MHICKQDVTVRTLRLATRLEDSDSAEKVAEELVNHMLSMMFRLATMNDRIVLKRAEPELSTRIALSINALSIQIAAATKRGAGNFVLANDETIKLLSGSMLFEPLPQELAAEIEAQHKLIKAVGSLNGKTVRVYSSRLIPADTFIIGYKGMLEQTQNIDAGLIYCPYVPVQLSQIVDPATLSSSIGLMTREAIAVMQEENGMFASASSYFRLLEVV